MALRINTAIVSGWIDNITPGETRGGVEVLGLQRPLEIVLKGNCARDLAGTRLDFKNPNPQPQPDEVKVLHMLQRGVVGDLSASQKVKALLISQSEIIEYLEAGKDLPYLWKNCLFLEWYSIANGHVIIESTDFEMKLSQHKWELDKIGEREQQTENALALDHFMELITHANEAESHIKNDFNHEADEFEWERRLRVKDSLEEAVEFLSVRSEEDEQDLLDVDLMNGRDILVKQSYALQMEVILYLGNSFLDDGSRGELADVVLFVFETLNEACPEKGGADLEKGYQIAMLKRAADACSVGIAACNTLEMEDDGFKSLRTDIFDMRDMMMDRVRDLRVDDAS